MSTSGHAGPHNFVNSLKFDCETFNFQKSLRESFSEINALRSPNPLDDLDLSDKLTPLNWREEQQNDTTTSQTLSCLETGTPSDFPYMNTERRKYLVHFDQFENIHGILYRKFYDDTGRNFNRQYVVPIHLRNEVLYRFHSSKYAGHPGNAETA